MISWFVVFKRQVRREWLIQVRQLPYLLNSSLFFLMMTVFFPLTLPADSLFLTHFAPGLVWMALLLSLLLSSDRLFLRDLEEGSLEVWLVSGIPLTLTVFAKLCVHWFLTLIPLLLFCPLLGVLFSLTVFQIMVLMLTIFCGAPVLLCLSALSAAFSLQVTQKGVLMALILLPLTLPVMIFGSGTLTMAINHQAIVPYLAFLMALSLITFSLIPFVIALVIRIGQGQ